MNNQTADRTERILIPKLSGRITRKVFLSLIFVSALLITTAVVAGFFLFNFYTVDFRKFTWNDYRLPNVAQPLRYELEIWPHFYEDSPKPFRFDASVQIYLKFTAETNEIIMHAVGLKFIDVQVMEIENGKARKSPSTLRLLNRTELPQFDLHVFTFTDVFNQRAIYVLDIAYYGFILENARDGLFYRAFKNNDAHMITTHLQPTQARYVFPCFDEPRFKAVFKLTLIRRVSHYAVANTPILLTTEKNYGWLADKFEETPLMSTYLLAFVITNMSKINSSDSIGRSYGVIAPESDLKRVNHALQITPTLMSYFENWFNLSYPISKLDYLMVPSFVGGDAMENWGLVTFKDKVIRLDSFTSTLEDVMYLEVVVSHELAHQWFGNLVTLDWWNDLWLNEGVSSYFAYIGLESLPEYEQSIDELFVCMYVHSALKTNSMGNVQSLDQQVYTPQEISQKFSTVNYGKAASLTRMMRYILTPTTFQRAINRYLKTYAYLNVKSSNLLTQLSDQWRLENREDSVDMAKAMQSWISLSGYPLITIRKKIDESANSCVIEISQQKFSLEEKLRQGNETLWHVPYNLLFGDSNSSLTSQQQPQKLFWLTEKATTKNCSDFIGSGRGWVVANSHQFGFYRVQYENLNWQLLTDQLLTDSSKLDKLTRSQLIDDAFTFAEANQLDYPIALNLTTYLGNEYNYAPWYAFLRHFDYIESLLPYAGICWKNLQLFLEQLLKPVVNGWPYSNMSGMAAKRLHYELSARACSIGLSSCVTNARKLLQASEAGANYTLADFGHILCAPNSLNAWSVIFNKLQQSNNEQSRFLVFRRAIKCNRDSQVISKFFEKLATINQSEELINSLLPEAFFHGAGRFAGLDFLKSLFLRESSSRRLQITLKFYFQLAQNERDLQALEEVQTALKKPIIEESLAKIRKKVASNGPAVAAICGWLERKLNV